MIIPTPSDNTIDPENQTPGVVLEPSETPRRPFISLPIFPLLIDAILIIVVFATRTLTASRYLQWWDSVQFALGLSNYDITRHQPHPLGYPGYIGLAWLIKQYVHDDNTALVIVGGISAAIIAVTLHHLGRAMIGPRAGFFAGILGALNPLLWYFSDVALSYIMGTAFATLAVYAAYSARGQAKLWIPILAGVASICWNPMAGIFIFPVCLFAFMGKWPGRGTMASQEEETDAPSSGIVAQILWFVVLFLIPNLIGYIPVIIHTGGLGPYLGVIQGESGKHVSQLSQWLSGPLDEFIKNTGALADFFHKGLGIGRWLLLILLIPMPGERGPNPRRAVRLISLAAGGLLSIYLGNTALIAAGTIAGAISIAYLLPDPTTQAGRIRHDILVWWLVPGLLLMVPIYANFIGVLIIFLPGLVLIEAWAIDRAADFMALQTVRDPSKVVRDGETIIVPGKKSDVRVERLVAYVLILLIAMHDVGVFINKSASQESFSGIVTTDTLVESVVSGIHDSPVAEKDIFVLGGVEDYRHWTYYLPDAHAVWTKYILYEKLRPGVTVWLSYNRHQDKIAPDVSTGPNGKPRASISLGDAKAVFVRPKEFELFSGTGGIVEISGKAPEGEKPEMVGYLIDTAGKKNVVFSEGRWWME